ncbi:hypothetical protein [Halobellus sp.]|uniref:hypothetical protein n=1 Tax=Halobellus sp. TaxID=1979212 RepID=UPI0035D51F16
MVIPLSMLLIEFGIHLREQHGTVIGWNSQVIAGSQVLGGILVIGAIGSLVMSIVDSMVTTTE